VINQEAGPATLTATVLEDAATGFGSHASAETVLLLTSALGGLVSHFHGLKKVKGLGKLIKFPVQFGRGAKTSRSAPLVNSA